MPRRPNTLVPIDLEIERTFQTLRKTRSASVDSPRVRGGTKFSTNFEGDKGENSKKRDMANNVPLKDLGTPGAFQATCGIRSPTTEANDFEIRPALITLVQSSPFCGMKHESPHNHLKEFESVIQSR